MNLVLSYVDVTLYFIILCSFEIFKYKCYIDVFDLGLTHSDRTAVCVFG